MFPISWGLEARKYLSWAGIPLGLARLQASVCISPDLPPLQSLAIKAVGSRPEVADRHSEGAALASRGVLLGSILFKIIK